MACSSVLTDLASQCRTARSVSDWIVVKWKLYYFILLVETKLRITERACSFEQLPARVNRMWTIVQRQIMELSTTATTIKGKLCMLLQAYVLPILAQYVFQ